MDLLLSPSSHYKNPLLEISGSKSESNRLLILKSLFPNINVSNLSDSDDTKHLSQALEKNEGTINIGHAGTAMRFLTAYFASKEGIDVMLTGSERMQQRPIEILVDALGELGASITYQDKQGYPPIAIKGRNLSIASTSINAQVSSQYISALLLIAGSLPDGLQLKLEGQVTSRPYIEMTTSLLKSIGIKLDENYGSDESEITVYPAQQIEKKSLTVESDWSSAGYWYSWVALQPAGYSIELNNFKEDSIQGDKRLVEVYKTFGVSSTFTDTGIKLKKETKDIPSYLSFDLTDIPDQAQTIFCTALGLGIELQLTGLHTLRIKETDRIEALRLMGLRFRESEIKTTSSTLHVTPSSIDKWQQSVEIETFNDHRMAMAFAPLSCKIPLIIKDADVVTKSYVKFWEHLNEVNIKITEI